MMLVTAMNLLADTPQSLQSGLPSACVHRIARVMILYLKARELMHSLQRVVGFCLDPQSFPRSVSLRRRRESGRVLFHDFYNRRNLIVNEHRNREITLREPGGGLAGPFPNRREIVSKLIEHGAEVDAAFVGEHSETRFTDREQRRCHSTRCSSRSRSPNRSPGRCNRRSSVGSS